MNSEMGSPVDHPGTVIKAELEARGWTQRDLAFVLGKQEPQLNRILSGKNAISADMALALGAAFDVPADFFANLQKQYELSQAKQPDPSVKRRAALQANYPLRDMIKRGWIHETDTSLLELQIARFFEVRSINEAPYMPHAAKKSSYDSISPAQTAWLFRVRQLARTISTPKYSEAKLRMSLPRLRAMTIEPETVSDVAKVLNDCGVKLVFVETIANAKIDGVCLWLDETPVVGLSLRFDRLDNFWFVLRHEIEHVLRGDGKQSAVIDDLAPESSKVDETESEFAANVEAAEFCVPQNKMSSFIARKGQFVGEKDIVALAGVIGTHPALVVGQWHRRTGRFQIFRKYLVPVRKHLLGNERTEALVDGWGSIASVTL
jgi:HTH-type transcriptional regulator/antitoxin HigA